MPIPIDSFLDLENYSLVSVDLSQANPPETFIDKYVAWCEFEYSCEKLHFLLDAMH